MNAIAIVLASIAAIAASAQAYLIWRDFAPEPSRIESERINSCKSLISGMSIIQRDLIDIDEQVERNFASINGNLNLYSGSMSENEKQAQEDETRRSAQNFAIGNTIFELEKLQGFVDVGSLFFSPSETAEMDLTTIRSVVETLPTDGMSRLAGGYEFDYVVVKLQEVAERLPAIKKVCEPIILKK